VEGLHRYSLEDFWVASKFVIVLKPASITYKFFSKFNAGRGDARTQRASLTEGAEEEIEGGMNKKRAARNLFLSAVLCAFASLRLCVKFSRGPRHTLRHEMGFVGNRMRARAAGHVHEFTNKKKIFQTIAFLARSARKAIAITGLQGG
jgi:hypothetical protein